MEVYDVIQELASNNSRNFKIELLEKHVHNNVLKTVIHKALDPFTQFYIRKIPKYEPTGHSCIMEAMKELFLLESRQVTGNAGIEHLTQILNNLSPKNAKVIELIIAKDLKCGVSTATVNAVWPSLIAEYPVMLASKMEKKTLHKMTWPAYVQLKLDGMRFNAIVRDGKVEFRSRNGKEINLLGHLEADFKQMAGKHMDVVFDGELVVAGDDGLLDRQTGNGILNKAVKGTLSESEAAQVRAVVWDYIPYAYFIDGICPMPYSERIDRIENTSEKVQCIHTYDVENIDEANELFQKFLDQGEEGIMLKSRQHIWENKRSKNLIKFKAELDCDLRVVGYQRGTGKFQDMLGALICESEDGQLKVNVGSGFNDEDRKKLTKENVEGKVITVKYNARIQSKNGDESLFLPIFVEVREDKDQADAIEDIK
jgi:ATP-dependent DNA ligase